MSAPAYFHQRRLDGLYAIYDARGPVLGYEDIPCRGEAESHILDLMEADRQAAFQDVCEDLEADLSALIAEAQADRAALDDFEAQAHAMAYGPAVTRAA